MNFTVNALKQGLEKCAEENENRTYYTGQVIVSSICRSAIECITEFEKEKENYRWHNLKEDPNDLPKEDAEYACKVLYYDSEKTFNAFLNYNSEKKVFWLEDLESTFNVVAWREVPEFEE